MRILQLHSDFIEYEPIKKEIKIAAEQLFESPVASVKTVITQKGKKKALIRLQKEGAAGEIAIRLGII